MLPFPHPDLNGNHMRSPGHRGRSLGKAKLCKQLATELMAWKPGSCLTPLSCSPVLHEHKLYLLSLVGGAKTVRTQRTRERGRRGSLAALIPVLPLLGGNLLPAHPQWDAVLAVATLWNRHSFSPDPKTWTEEKNFFKLSKTITLQTETKPEAFQLESRCFQSSEHTSKWGLESPEGSM